MRDVAASRSPARSSATSPSRSSSATSQRAAHVAKSTWRGPWLRFGPAPYHTDHQIRSAMEALGEVAAG